MKKLIYFSISSLTVLQQQKAAPETKWDALHLFASMLVAGLVALRALESSPDKHKTPTP